jgi:ADP-L-glycero-D-manno-heptose 6-epimerase
VGPVAVCDWFGTEEKWRNIAKRRIGAFVSPPDLIAFLEAYRPDVETIIHMGAISATTEQDVDRLSESNLNYSVRLWDWCAANDTRFVYASSAATCGGIESGYMRSVAVQIYESIAKGDPVPLFKSHR